ncbi:MAG: NTP transferase domain-containing protein, partial [Leptolyngbya sp. SIO1D8]|nr:NTP transferase domain-containing protein [Leptolyngbya sp. SIO1D8]
IPPAPDRVLPGPLVAFTNALTYIEATWILLLACDMPALQADILQQWHQTLPQVAAEAIAYLPRHPKGWEPLCGFYRHRCLPDLQSYVVNGGKSFQKWLHHQRVQTIPQVPVEILVNCNTPADWEPYVIKANS